MSLLIAGHPEHHCVWTSSSQSSSCPPSVLLLATTQPSSQRPPGNTLQVLWYVKHESDCLCVGVFTGHNSTQLSATAGEYTTSTVVREAWEWLSLCGCVYWPQLNPALSDRRGIHYKYCGTWSMRVTVFVWVCLLATTQGPSCGTQRLCVGVFTAGEYTTSTVVREAWEWLSLCGCVYWPQPSSQRPPGNTLQVLWYVKHESDCLCVGVFTGHNPALSNRQGIHYKYCGTWSMRVTVFVWVCLLATTQLSATTGEYTTSTVYVKHESDCLCVGVFTGHNPALSDRQGIHYKYCGTWSMRVTVFVWVCLLATTQPSSHCNRWGIYYKYCGTWSMRVTVFVWVCLLATTQLSATAREYTTSTVVCEAWEWLSLCGCVYWPQPSSQRPPGNTLQVLWYVKHESDCLCVGVFTGHNPALSNCRRTHYKRCGTLSLGKINVSLF